MNSATEVSNSIADFSNQNAITISNQYNVKNFIDQLILEIENNLSAFLKKKPLLESKGATPIKLADALPEYLKQNNVYSICKFSGDNSYSIVFCDMQLLHQILNLLYGNEINSKDQIIEKPGGIGLIIAHKLNCILMDSLVKAYAEYNSLAYEPIKTTAHSHFSPYINVQENFHHLQLVIKFSEMEATINFILPPILLETLCPTPTFHVAKADKASWHNKINNAIIDTNVLIKAELAPLTINIKELLPLKVGDEIAISNPTEAFLLIENNPIYKAHLGKSGALLVAKIIDRI